MREGDDLVKGIETLSEPVRIAALGSWEDFESKRVLMDLYAARAALAQSRAALEATTDHQALQGAAEHEKNIFKHFGKTIPKVMKTQEDAIGKFEDLILDYTKASIHHEESLGHPDLTDSGEQHLTRRAELFGEAAQAAMRDILAAVSKESMMVKHAVPKIIEAIKASEESQIGTELAEATPMDAVIEETVVAELPPPAQAEESWTPAEEDSVVEEAEVVEMEPEPGPPEATELSDVMEMEPAPVEVEEEESVEGVDMEPAPEGSEREELIIEEAEEVKMAADLVSDHGIEPGPSSDFALTLSKIAEPLKMFFSKNTTIIQDAFKASEDALRDYERAIKAAQSDGRVASQNSSHGFNLTA